MGEAGVQRGPGQSGCVLVLQADMEARGREEGTCVGVDREKIMIP